MNKDIIYGSKIRVSCEIENVFRKGKKNATDMGY